MRRHYSPAIEALHREGWEDAMVEGPLAIAQFHEGERLLDHCEQRLARLVRAACWWTAHDARRRLAQAGEHPRAIHDAATPARTS